MRRTVAAAASALIAGALVAGAAVGFPRGPEPALRGFTVTGSVDGLLPGGRAWLRATVRNPYRRPLRVTSVTAAVGRGGRACAGSNLHVRPFTGRLVVPPRRARVVRLRVEMPMTAAPECSGVRFPLRFRAKGFVP